MRTFRVAFVAACPFPYPRGTPTRILRMAEALVQRGHKIHVVTYHLGKPLHQSSLKLHRTPRLTSYQKLSPGPTYQKLLLLDALLAAKLWRVLRQYPVDLIHAHHYEGLLVAAMVRKFTKHRLIYDAHTMLQSELPFYDLGLSHKLKASAGAFLDRWLPHQADHVIAVSEDIRRKLSECAGLPADHITTISMGVGYQHFQVTQTPPPRPYKVLLFAGNLAPYQGVEFMLHAFCQVLRRHSNARLHIVSDTSFDRYEPLAQGLGVRRHIDLIQTDFEHLPLHLAAADVMLNPRVDCDGVPLKLLNYMAAGKPVVSFASSAKVIQHLATGLVVADRDTSQFADAVCNLLANPALAAQLGANAMRYVQREHSWERVAEQTEAVYQRVVSPP